MAARKRWLAGQVHVAGRLYVDDGAATVLNEKGRSLLPVGVQRVEGAFERGAIVACHDLTGREIARGLVNYDSNECTRIAGRPSGEIEPTIGYAREPELIHRDNLVLSREV